MGIETKLEVKQLHINNIPTGRFFLDHVVKMTLGQVSAITIEKVFVFDGLSLRRLDLKDDVRSKITIKKSGKVSISPKNDPSFVGTSSVVMNAVGVGFVSQIPDFLYNHTSLQPDQASRFSAILKQGGGVLGGFKSFSEKYNRFSKPRTIFPNLARSIVAGDLSEIEKKPLVVTSEKLSFNSLVEERMIHARSNIEITNLNPDFLGSVERSAFEGILTKVLWRIQTVYSNGEKKEERERDVNSIPLVFSYKTVGAKRSES